MQSRAVIPATIVLLLLAPACTERAELAGPPVGPPANVVMPTGVSVVMSGLDSPRGLAFGPEGALYVTEAGDTTITGPCLPVMEGAMLTQKCFSGTGAISRLWHGTQERIVSGLPSTYLVSSKFAAGPQDIDFQGRGNGLVVMGFGAGPDVRAGYGAAGEAQATLIKLQPDGGWRVLADLAAYEGSANPDGGQLYSNPYGILAEAGRNFVTDAGGNSLLEVSANGEISLVATFPATAAPPPWLRSEPVPTRVVRGPDGALYVSTLSGVPFLVGSAAIYRVVPGTPPALYAGGFTTIADLDFGPDGSLYVLQFSSGPVFFAGPGRLIHVAPDGTRTDLLTNLVQPTGVEVGPDGSVYVSNRGTQVDTGEVLKVTF